MKIAFLGDGVWAHKAFAEIIKSDYEIKIVIVRHDSGDPILIDLARKYNIEVKSFKNINDQETIEYLSTLLVDIGVSMSFNQILKKPLIDLFPYKFINCHAGKLPFYRGRNILNWVLINDEKDFGITCHYIDEGIDTGAIIHQEIFSISDADDYSTLLTIAQNNCPVVLLKALNSIRDKTTKVRVQPKEGTYFSQRKSGDEFIDWAWESRTIFNFVRSITAPGPYARTWIEINDEYKLVLIKKVRLVDNSPRYIATPGAIIGKLEGNPIIKTGDTYIEVVSYEILDSHKKHFYTGDRLGINMNTLLSKKLFPK